MPCCTGLQTLFGYSNDDVGFTHNTQYHNASTSAFTVHPTALLSALPLAMRSAVAEVRADVVSAGVAMKLDYLTLKCPRDS